jgi:fucose 4-O-acetylase-like acetyltransferase
MRDSTFDALKGVGIISMIIGHSYIPSILIDFIFAWHMPLFFIVSGFFYKKYPIKDYNIKNIRRLVLPYLFTSFFIVFFFFIKNIIKNEPYDYSYLIGALIGNGSHNNPIFGSYSIGAIWFLLAIFWCRIIYNFIICKISESYNINIYILFLSFGGAFIGKVIYIPMDILQGLQALLFFHIGYLWKQNYLRLSDLTKEHVFIILLLIIFSVWSGSMSIVRSYYGFYPINFLAAIGTVALFYYLFKKMNCSTLLYWLCYVGRLSLLILCVHNIELTCGFIRYFHGVLDFSSYFDFILHLIISLSCTFILIRFSLVRRLFALN